MRAFHLLGLLIALLALMALLALRVASRSDVQLKVGTPARAPGADPREALSGGAHRAVEGALAPLDEDLRVRQRASVPSARMRPGAARVAEVEERFWRVPIEAGELPVPPDGTPIRFLSGEGKLLGDTDGTLPPATRMIDGALVVREAGGQTPGDFLAQAPDGSLAHVRILRDADQARPTSFSRPRTVSVHVRQPDGAAVEGAHVALGITSRILLGEWLATDADGGVDFADLLSGRAKLLLLVRPPGCADAARVALAVVDLSYGDADIAVTVPSTLDFSLRFLERGVPRLPGTLRVEDAVLVAEDPEHGIARLQAILDHRLEACTVPVLRSSVELGSGTTELGTIELEHGATLVVRLSLPESHPRSWFNCRARRLEPPVYERSGRGDERGEAVVLRGLSEGSWEVEAGFSLAGGRRTETTLVRLGPGEEREIAIDLR